MIRITDQYFWNFVFAVFFIVLVVMGLIVLETEARIVYTDLTLFDVSLITLASFRLIRLFVYDTVTKFIREQFWDAKKVRGGVILEKPKVGPRRTIADMFSCTWCIGTWMSALVAFFYLLTPLAYFPVLILAISAVATLLQNISRLIYIKAEE